MRLRVLVIASIIIVCGGAYAVGREEIVAPPAMAKAVLANVERQAIVFFVAKGEPNACGKGCDEWIAADGAFDFTAGKRFKDFLEALPRHDLPIFFNSAGGSIRQAAEIALILRSNRMRAGVARTVPQGCRSEVATDDACRRLIASRRILSARLIATGASCQSSCVVAFVGASTRQVAADARIGVHSFFETQVSEKAPKFDEVDAVRRRLFVLMGVDQGVMDLVNKTSFDRMHFLSRSEIAKLGIETRGFYETSWTFDRYRHLQGQEQIMLRKSVTQAESAESNEYRTARIVITCPVPSRAVLYYERDLSKNEGVGKVFVQIGDRQLEFDRVLLGKDLERREVDMNPDLLRKVAAEPTIEIVEKMWLQGESRSRISKLSTNGLSSSLERCIQPSPTSAPPAQATAR